LSNSEIGRWEVQGKDGIPISAEILAVHAALLHTGKVTLLN
jgi:hypothetical protein